MLLRNVILVVVSGFLVALTFKFVSWYLPIVIESKWGTSVLAVVWSISYVAPLLALFISPLADVFGRKPMIVIANLLLLLGFLACLLIGPHLLVFLFLLIVYTLVPTIVSSALLSLISESVGSKYQGRVFSIAKITSSAGIAAGSLLFGYLLTYYGYDTAFLIACILVTISLILRLFLVETLRPSTGNVSNVIREIFQRIKLGFEYSRDRICFVVLVVLLAIAQAIVEPYFPVYFVHVAKLTLLEVSIVYTLFFVAGLVAGLPAEFFIDKYGPKYAYTIACLSMALSDLVFVLLVNLGLRGLPPVLVMLVGSFFSTFSTTAFMVYVSRTTEQSYRTTVYTTLTVIHYASMIPGPIIGGILYNKNPNLPIIVEALIQLITMIIATKI